jgi:D-alanine transaminase
MIVYLNGEFLPLEKAGVSPLDRGFLFSDAIYEVVRFDRGRPYRLEEHLRRMREGLLALRIGADAGFYPAAARRLLAENGLAGSDAVVYAQVSRGAAPRTHVFPPEGTPATIFAFARASDPPPGESGSSAILVPDQRWGRCDIKTVMLLPNVLAAQEAREAGAMDAIFVRDGLALEGTKANLFALIEGKVRTAPNGPSILPGVTRGAVIEAASRLSIRVEERGFTVEEMFSAAEVFLASTTLWTHSLVKIADRRIGNGEPGPLAARLREALQREFGGTA